MILTARIGLSELARLCHRLGTAVDAGIDVRKMFQREAEGRVPTSLRKRLADVAARVARGTSVSEALAATGGYFPPLFHEMVQIGEESGRLGEVLTQLRDHYEHQLKMRRDFLASITWPVFQLAAAISVIGLLILVMGWISSSTGNTVDILGLGLVGTRGLAIYLGILAVIAGGIALLIHSVGRGLFWTRPLQYAILQIPALGPCLRTLALARMAWTMYVTMDSGMELKRSLPLSLRSTGNARFYDHADEVVRAVLGGTEISHALTATGAFPRDFLDTLEVGEHSGRIPESMAILSRQYQDQARRAMGVLNVIGGFLVWACVAVIIILMIFRLAMFYIGTLNEAAGLT
jgi:type II secretory pathway component PulF